MRAGVGLCEPVASASLCDPRELAVLFETLARTPINISNWDPRIQEFLFLEATRAALKALRAYFVLKSLLRLFKVSMGDVAVCAC